MIAQSQVRDEDVEIGSIPSLLRSHPLELAKLGKELRRIEKRAALQRRKRQNSVTRFAQIVPGLRHRGCSRLKCGLYGLISLKSPQSKHKDYIETALQTIDTFIQWSRSHERILASFSSSNGSSSSGDATELKHFCYARPRVTFQNADQIPRRRRQRPQLEFDDEPAEEEWRVQTNFNMNNSAMGCEQEIKRLRYDFRRLVHDLKGSHIAAAINLSIPLPPRQSWCRMEDEGLEEQTDGDAEDIEHNANALLVVGDENQSQINFAKVKSSQEVHKPSSNPVKNKTQLSEFYSCNFTIFAAYIALRTRLGVTLAYVLRNQIRDFLIEEHECDATGCQDEEVTALPTGTDTTDTAAFRVVTHVAVVEVMQQSIIMASQGLHEHCTDTYYSFTFRYTDAITVATVFLIRQFVQFPNVVTTSNPLVRDVYERSKLCLTIKMELYTGRLRFLICASANYAVWSLRDVYEVMAL
ncbi:hypothetical protein EGR_08328 [Echinococcus granulosus]|uniref:Uncharacterized protein n=1 Tax=Echinococcus granulosus TaxID=6210 RepID=W6UTQ9_ECHGR|nr:hypothetical protein EGR_08328 [Echinococcus granulosus]EUB56804.1 hypothetical protein EGR_08328 [Echinococcus granulosus]